MSPTEFMSNIFQLEYEIAKHQIHYESVFRILSFYVYLFFFNSIF